MCQLQSISNVWILTSTFSWLKLVPEDSDAVHIFLPKISTNVKSIFESFDTEDRVSWVKPIKYEISESMD